MVDLDLRKLSAPIEALRPKVQAAYKSLDSQWKAIKDQLNILAIPCNIWFVYSRSPHGDESTSLEWRKFKGSKRLCIVQSIFGNTPHGYDEEELITPFEEWSAEEKVNLLHYVPNLFESAAKQTEAFINKINGQEDKS